MATRVTPIEAGEDFRRVPAALWTQVAERLDVPVGVLRAVADVESDGEGFLAAPDRRPKVLFEGHAFSRLTQHRFDATHPDISHPAWDRSKYAGGAREHERLVQACALDRAAALQSASWGAFQVMGFHHAACGFADVETFVAAHTLDAASQLEAFARFIDQPRFREPLTASPPYWVAFARAYNGPKHARLRYVERLRAAYARHGGPVARGRGAAARRAAAVGMAASGRPDFASNLVDTGRRAEPRRRYTTRVRPDPIDLRDWLYRPSIAPAPRAEVAPARWFAPKDQGDTSACTGYGLAAVIEHLLAGRGDAPEAVSGPMLYSMARRYDEWKGNDDVDEGSSLRGALKGWSRHGASAQSLWPDPDMPKFARARPLRERSAGTDWWLDAVRRPLGAYYRLTLDAIGDIQVALNEARVVYASAYTHAGWTALLKTRATPLPKRLDELPLIDNRAGQPDAGHAFAIVGYDARGFVVQNSWGARWGAGGHAVLAYADWLRNAMDCWVVQLGVVTAEHLAIAQSTTLRVVGGGDARVRIARGGHEADREISPYVIDMGNEGRLSQRGQFRTQPDDVRLIANDLLPRACAEWGIARGGTVDVAIYAHGGLVGEDDAAVTARDWVPLLYSNRIFPVFLMWETGAARTVANLVEDALRGEAPAARGWWDDAKAWWNERIEGIARVPGGAMWREMKQNADALSLDHGARDDERRPGVQQLFDALRDEAARLPTIRLHLVGHSAGAVVHAHLAPRAQAAGFALDSASLIAPAVRLDLFDRTLGRLDHLRLFIAHLTDAAERADPTCKPYGHSLLYLVSRSFEDRTGTPILGMERHLVPELVARPWGARLQRLVSPGPGPAPGARQATSSTHGGLDDDAAVQDAVVRMIRRMAPDQPVLRPVR